jgi:hypothetical protein
LCCLFPIATVRRRRLWESLGAWRSWLWAVVSGRARQVTLDHTDPMCSLSFSSIHIGPHALILYLSLILRIWVCTWLVMLSHAVMSAVQVFLSFVMLSLVCVFVSDGLPSVEMWFDRGEDRCCDLSKDGMVETVGFHQVMWFVMLEFAKDRILGVDTLGQHVLPCVRYGIASLLIRVCYRLCVVLGWVGMAPICVTRLCDILCELPEPHGAKGATLCSKPQHYKRGHVSGNYSKAWHTPIVDLCNGM